MMPARRSRIIAALGVALAASVVAGMALSIAAAVAAASVLLGCVAIVLILFPYPRVPRVPDEPSAPDLPPASQADSPEQDGAPLPEEEASDSSPATSEGETQEEQAQEAEPSPETETSTSPFSFSQFTYNLLTSKSPLEFLCDFAEETATRTDASPFERYLAQRLSEAHVATWKYEKDAPNISIAVPHHSGGFYLREPPHVQLGHHIQILMIEAALNAARFANDYFDDLLLVDEDDLVKLEQRHANSICAQASNVTASDWTYLAMPWQTGAGPTDRGEWAVRSSFSESIETLQVPYRLTANFRTNVAGGDVAIEVAVTPARAFPRTMFTDGLGIVPTTSHTRNRMASNYAARVAILLANCAFRASDRIRRVWIAGIKTTPSSRTCLYWARFERRLFSHVRMDAIDQPLEQLRLLGATINVENEVLQAVDQGFYLEDERFCPPLRHDLWQLSERSLPPSAALSLGTQRVSGLIIHEELLRTLVAEDAIRGFTQEDGAHATEQCVRSVLDAAHKTSDVDVWSAAERVAAKLVSGTLALDNLEALEEELVSGDPFTRAVERAQKDLQHHRPEEAFTRLEKALRTVDQAGTYDDTPSIAYRSFDSFAQRALYNRLNARDARCVVLVPDAYVIAHLLFSALLLARSHEKEIAQPNDAERALRHARRAHEVAPLSIPATLCVVACQEAAGNIEEAAHTIAEMLELAHDPQGIALAYYRMASMQWQLGRHKACLACYQLAAGISPMFVPIVLAEWHALAGTDPSLSEPLEASELERVLSMYEIPLAPTARISFLLFDCAAASIDAEVFPVARDLMRILELFTGDDVIHGIRNSLEREPDE